MTTTRTADHLAQSLTGSDVVHAAADFRRMHTLACSGRTIQAAAWTGTADQITCPSCIKGIASGRIVVAGPLSTTTQKAA